MTDKEKDNRVNALAMTFLEELQIAPHPFADQILRAYKAGYHQSEKDSLPKEPVSKDLEEASQKYAKSEYDRKNPANLPDRCKGCYAPIMYAFRNGAKWQKEQMMTKAIRGRVSVESNYHNLIYGCWDMDNALKNCNDGDKVKVIIIRED